MARRASSGPARSPGETSEGAGRQRPPRPTRSGRSGRGSAPHAARSVRAGPPAGGPPPRQSSSAHASRDSPHQRQSTAVERRGAGFHQNERGWWGHDGVLLISSRRGRIACSTARRVFSRALPRRRAGRARRQPPTLPSLPLSAACVGAPPTPRSRRASDPSALPAPRAPRRATLHGAVPMPARRHNSHAGQRAIPALPPLSGECRGRGATTRSAVTRQAGWVVVVERGSERRRGRPTGPARARRARAAPPLPRDRACARVHRCGWAW